MYHEQDCSQPNRGERNETFFVVGGWVALCKRVWILECQRGRREAYPVLQEVCPVLLFIPFEEHRTKFSLNFRKYRCQYEDLASMR